MMDLIPIQYYSAVYNYFILFVILSTAFHLVNLQIDSKSNLSYNKVVGNILLIFAILYIGYRPIERVFEDMIGYAQRFDYYKRGGDIIEIRDGFFQILTKASSYIMGVHTYFLLCAAAYIVPLYIVSKKWFSKYWFYAFLMLLASFSFWGYGVNGIRNGIATSLFLLGLSYKKSFLKLALLFTVSALIHKSMLLPIGAYFLTTFYRPRKTYYALWMIAIVLSLSLGAFWENLFANLGLNDDRISYLTSDSDVSKFSRVGFRWDFLIYSALGIFAGWYYIIKRKYNDALYIQIVNIYLITNSIWILVIRANFSNRFAYLSWFMLAIVIIYPLLKARFFKSQNTVLASILLIYYLITFLLNEIL